MAGSGNNGEVNSVNPKGDTSCNPRPEATGDTVHGHLGLSVNLGVRTWSATSV